jgi:aspartyl-tRNA(Asn)/glutamyl-tRNA(Gln) amidotransferase subunit A
MPSDTLSLSIVELADKLKGRELSPVEVVEQCISRIDQINGILNAFVTVPADQARRAAKMAEEEIRKGGYRGPLHGIPLGIKDIIDTSGIRTTYGSAIFRSNVPEKDAFVVSRLKEAGAIVLGKTNTHEFAFGVTTNNVHYGATRNPWALDRIPGGSSGGSAAAVASYLCYGAIGTDTGGSIRIPSAFCAVIGLKPTYGMVGTRGVFPLAMGLDHVGPMARSVLDTALMLQAMAGFDVDDPRSLNAPIPDLSEGIGASVENMKIAISPDLIPEIVDRDTELAYKSAMSKIEGLGGEILEKKIKTSHLIGNVSTALLGAEAAAQHSELLKEHSDEYGANVISRFRAGQKVTTAEYIKALRDSEVIRREMELIFDEAGFLLTPSVQILPPRIGEDKIMVEGRELDIISCCVRFTRLANITGMPAIVLPYGYSADGLPLSVQLMAPRLHEKQLLNLACAIEKATPELRNRRPQFCQL